MKFEKVKITLEYTTLVPVLPRIKKTEDLINTLNKGKDKTEIFIKERLEALEVKVSNIEVV